MKNLRVKQFEAKVSEIVAYQKEGLVANTSQYLKSLESIELTVFSNENPYNGKLKNKIFFTYNNHYRGNSGTWMSVGELNHPHSDYEDRGYLKGVATDLDGYLKLKKANSLFHNFEYVYGIYYPKFNTSKNSGEYQSQCDQIVKKAITELNDFVASQKSAINAKLREVTDCSLLHYLRDI